MAERYQEPRFGSEEVSINVLELFVRFARLWRTGLITFVISMVIAAFFILRIKPLYEATVTILPNQAAEETNSLSSLFSGKHPGEAYVGLVRSRTVVDDVIAKTDLRTRYKTQSWEVARFFLRMNTRVGIGTDTLMNITVRDENAIAAMQIANTYLDALATQQQAMTLELAQQRTEIFQKQLQAEKDALNQAEQDLRKAQESSGVVQVQDQTQMGLSAIATLRSQIASLQVQLSSVLLGSTEQNPQVKVLRSQIAQLEAEERALETGRAGSVPGAAITAQRIPQARLEQARREREVKYHEVLLGALSNQLENARLSASLHGSFQIVDKAVVPEFRAWPPRNLLFLGSAAASVFLGLVAIALELLFHRLISDPANIATLRGLRSEHHPVHK